MCDMAGKSLRIRTYVRHPPEAGSRMGRCHGRGPGSRVRRTWPWLAGARSARLPGPAPAPAAAWGSVGPHHSGSLNVESVMQLSARNQIPATVTGINAGEAIANVELSANGVRLVASITVEAVRQLGLKEGSEVSAVIKASDVLLATNG